MGEIYCTGWTSGIYLVLYTVVIIVTRFEKITLTGPLCMLMTVRSGQVREQKKNRNENKIRKWTQHLEECQKINESN